MAVKAKPNEIQIIRVYDAPVDVVWDAWTDPAQVAKWWGPRGFTLTTHSKDLRPGGHWSYTMHGPDGTDYENTTKYFEVEKHAKLVYDHGGSADRPPLFRVTVLFSEADGKTTMDMTMALATAEAAAETRKFIKRAGGDSTWDRLAEYLEKESSGGERFVINRSFDAPRDAVFEMWTKPEHFAKWLPPTGFEMEFVRPAEIRPGGTAFWRMSNGADVTMYGRLHYLRVDRPHGLHYLQEFCDAEENVARHPMAPLWPAMMLTTVTLAEEAPDRTRVTVEWQPHGPATPEEVAAFVSEKAGMTGGWTGSFDKLEALLGS